MTQTPVLNNPLLDQKAKSGATFRFTFANNTFSDPDVINLFDNLIIFGDSLSDTGNIYQASGNTFPPSPPYFQGRFSNGLIWLDYLTSKIEFNQESIRNFAFGGANTGISNNFGGVTVPGLLTQIQQFTNQITTNPVSEDSLYMIWVGSNDFLNPPANPVQAVTDAVSNISSAITTLNGLGAENIVIANLTDLGATPLAISNGNSANATTISIAFNNALSQAIDNLETSLNINLPLVDIFALSQAVKANPESYGFTNLTERLINATGTVNPDEYPFFDDVHPSTRLHQFTSQTFTTTLINEGILSDILTYSATLVDGSPLPDWLNFNTITQTFNGTPTDENAGTLDVKVTATDKTGLTATDIFSIQVQNMNISRLEGNNGIQTQFFEVFLNQPATESRIVNYQTIPISAIPISGTNIELFSATLEGSQEVPGVTTDAMGMATLELDQEAGTLSYRLEVTGLDFNEQTETTADDVTMAHIHEAVRGESGSVNFDILADDDLEITVENGKTIISGIWETAEGLEADEIAEFTSAMMGEDTPYYFNIHTTTNPGGELRGQIVNETPVFIPTVEVFSATLEGSQEVPGVTTDAMGMATLELDQEGGTLSYRLEVTGLDFNEQTETTADDVTMAHIHEAVRGESGSVSFNILADDDLEITVENGKTIITGIWEAAEGLEADEIAEFTSAMMGEDTPYYFNIHTNANPGGELRGQIVSAAPDYVYTSGTLIFAPGESSKTIEVAIFGDREIESDETFKIVLTDANDSSQILGEQIITITNDDLLPPPLIFGTTNSEEINPLPGQILFAGDGDDIIYSSDENIIFAGDGDDEVAVNSHSLVLAGDGDDLVNVGVDGPAHETIANGGNGEDILSVVEADDINILFGAADSDNLKVVEGSNQRLFGGSGDDTIVSEGSNNRLYGGSGSDVLVSNENDVISGGSGDDVLFGGAAGGNMLTGGAGMDQFWVANGSLPMSDNIVTDFTIGVDKIGFGGVAVLNFGQVTKEKIGSDTLLKIGTTEIASLVGINADSLTANDFVFSTSVV